MTGQRIDEEVGEAVESAARYNDHGLSSLRTPALFSPVSLLAMTATLVDQAALSRLIESYILRLVRHAKQSSP